MREVEASAAALGLQAIWSDTQPEPVEVYLWPENVRVWNIFNACRTQWMVGMAGPTGLAYQGVEVVIRMSGIKQSERSSVFSKIQVMERAMLNAWSEKK